MKWTEIDFKVQKVKRLMGRKVHRDGFKPIDSQEWKGAVAFVR